MDEVQIASSVEEMVFHSLRWSNSPAGQCTNTSKQAKEAKITINKLPVERRAGERNTLALRGAYRLISNSLQ
jgi:hypothetical protein